MAYRRGYGNRGYGSRGRRYGSSSYRSNAGLEAAKKHIAEAAALSRELGGTDEDVKSYFYALNAGELKAVFEEYGRKYGQDKREYAERALPDWKSGNRQMSGLVAGRLFSLLPRRMPVSKKFDLVESLWRFKGPSSHRKIYVGPDACSIELTTMIQEHLKEKVQSYVIDETLSKRFDWLSENDSNLCQDLRNHFLHLEKEQLAAASYDRIGIMLAQIQRSDVLHQTLIQTFEVGKHQVKLHFSPKSSGISDKVPKHVYSSTTSAKGGDDSFGCLIGAVVLGLFILYSIFKG
jgi:hypothetical protein